MSMDALGCGPFVSAALVSGMREEERELAKCRKLYPESSYFDVAPDAIRWQCQCQLARGYGVYLGGSLLHLLLFTCGFPFLVGTATFRLKKQCEAFVGSMQGGGGGGVYGDVPWLSILGGRDDEFENDGSRPLFEKRIRSDPFSVLFVRWGAEMSYGELVLLLSER